MKTGYKIFALYDRVATSFLSLIPTDNVEVLKREYTNIVNEIGSRNPIKVNAKDLDLYELGSFDVETGDIAPCKKFIMAIGELIKNEV